MGEREMAQPGEKQAKLRKNKENKDHIQILGMPPPPHPEVNFRRPHRVKSSSGWGGAVEIVSGMMM